MSNQPCFQRKTDEELKRVREVFEMVEDPEDWKNPINKVIDAPDEKLQKEIEEAVIFYTASIPDFRPMRNGKVRVVAEGYYLATAGE